MSTAITVENVSKAYKLGSIGGASLVEDWARWWARVRRKPDPVAKIGRTIHPRQVGDVFWALEDVSFSVGEGEVIGLIGRNGAGKSTLLKILSQVTAPSSGQIELRGRIASLLEVGTGFHPELTGRENVFLNGAILGMTKTEIRTKFDEIVAFSECETFIDTPVKRYSSGMYVRLAFAVAAHLEPEILIVDEVLAVGDVSFQQKCLGKMRDVSRAGRTILFVSHNLAAVSALCSRAVLLKDGRLAADGETARVLEKYRFDQPVAENVRTSLRQAKRTGTGKGRFVSLKVVGIDGRGSELSAVTPGSDLLVETEIECTADFADAQVAAVFFDSNRTRIVDLNTALRADFLALRGGQTATVRFFVRDLLLKPGTYYVMLWLGRGALEEIDYVDDAGSWQMHEPAAKHTETFPGLYQPRFSHEIHKAGSIATQALRGA